MAVSVGITPACGWAQHDPYTRAEAIRIFEPALVGGRVEAVWFADGVRFYYEAAAGPHQGTLFLVDPSAGSKRPLFDQDRIATTLSALSGHPVDPVRLPAGRLVDADRAMLFEIEGALYRCTLRSQDCSRPNPAESAAERGKSGPEWVARSPDGRWDAFVWNHNVYLRPAALTDADPAALKVSPPPRLRRGCDGPAVPGPLPPPRVDPLPEGSAALTTDGTGAWGYGLYRFGVEVAQVEAERYLLTDPGIVWAPDSKRFLVRRDDLRGVRHYPLYSSTSRLPVDHSYFYAAPGDTVVLRYDYYVFDVAEKSGVKVDDAPHGLLGTRGEARWGDTSDELYVMHTSRGNKVIKLSRVDPVTGVSRALAADSMSTFVDEEMQSWAVVGGGAEFLWSSERDGWRHLYRFGADGALRNRITDGPWAVADIQHIDPVSQQIWFRAWGKEPGVPYYAHLYRVGFDGSGLVHLTQEEGNHSIQFAPGGEYFLDTYSSIDRPPLTVLRAADGRLVLELERGDAAGLRATGWTPAEVFTVKARDGETDLWGILHKPSDFDPGRRYPIITNVYPGPQIGSVRGWVFKGPDSWGGTRERVSSASLDTYSGDGMGRSLAELGFIVIQLDAMGTSKRSKPFQDFFHGRVRDNGLPDQISAIRQLAAQHSWIDTTRVGVWGHSGGGYAAAAAMLHYPEFFQVAVSQSGNHDFRIYGWYWGEKFQGPYRKTEAGDTYEDEANYKYASNLQGKLLLMSGDMDCNNPPAETLRLVDALIKADKPFDMLLVPDAGHQLPPYAMRRAWNYFVEHLQGPEESAAFRELGR